MSNFLRFLKSRFLHERHQPVSKHYEVFDEGSRGGFPSDVVSFDFMNGTIVIGTSSGDIVFYGDRGVSFFINLRETNSKIDIIKTIFISFNTVFVLCKGPIIIPIEINDGCITRHQDLSFDDNPKFQWKITHAQKFKESSSDLRNALIFCINDAISRVELGLLEEEKMIEEADIRTWCTEGNNITSITSSPDKSNIFMLFTTNGITGIYNQSQFLMILKIENFESEPIERIHWSSDGSTAFGISCNNKYTKWRFFFDKDRNMKAQEIGTYSSNQLGPYPCHPIRHFNIYGDLLESKDGFIVYQGGNSTGKHDGPDSVSVSRGDDIDTFYLSSEVIGIAVTSTHDFSNGTGVVLICTKSEIVGLDLKERCKVLRPEHFISINNSTPTCHARTIEIEENIWFRLNTVSRAFWDARNMSSQEWPLFSLKKSDIEEQSQRSSFRQLYISGHSNGNVCIWRSGGFGLALMFIIQTSVEFKNVLSNEEELEVNEQRNNIAKKIDLFDPFDDDEDLCIAKVHLDAKSGLLTVINRGGFILLYELCENKKQLKTWKPVTINHTCSPAGNIEPRETDFQYLPGYQLLQKLNNGEPLVFALPRSYQSSDIAYMHKYHCLVIGSNSGVIFLDAKYGYVVNVESFADRKHDLQSNRIGMTRFKTFKKSVRRTFRRKRKPNDAGVADTDEERHLDVPQCREQAFVERQIESKEDQRTGNNNFEDLIGSVTCLRVMRLPIADEKTVDDVVAVGLYDGSVVFYIINEQETVSQLTFKPTRCKLIQSSRCDPVLNVDVTSEEGYFSASTKLTIITDEQIRVYNCQPFSKKTSYKLTALEGLKIKNGVVAKTSKAKNANFSDSFIIILANDGNIRIHSVENPGCFKKKKLIDPSDVIALNSSCLSRDGTITYLIKSSVMQRHMINFDFAVCDSKNS